MSRNSDVAITKVEAARRQLDCAVRIFFEGEDYLAIHTLAHAAYNLLLDLHRKRGAEAINNTLDTIDRRRISRVANFLKHSDRDAKGAMIDHNPDAPSMLMSGASILYGFLMKRQTPEMAAIDLWCSAMYPEMFQDDHPLIAMVDDEEVRLILAELKRRSREEQLLLGKSLINMFREINSDGKSHVRET